MNSLRECSEPFINLHTVFTQVMIVHHTMGIAKIYQLTGILFFSGKRLERHKPMRGPIFLCVYSGVTKACVRAATAAAIVKLLMIIAGSKLRVGSGAGSSLSGSGFLDFNAGLPPLPFGSTYPWIAPYPPPGTGSPSAASAAAAVAMAAGLVSVVLPIYSVVVTHTLNICFDWLQVARDKSVSFLYAWRGLL